ncbi:MAG: type II toxin-antitoxin system RelE/ParE family toxin [Acidiphilium sp.]|nr:type II toxin-antitoxin system RelE/ParE family toxin [Acidiphilium sp.]MDD4936907.1 type II toxin-antitoxin system RelE/ParE family toxin [Acidiphilium sp.]
MIARWLASTRHDVTSIARHIATENPLAATRMAQELLIAGDSLASFPHRGRPGLAQGTRELVAVRPYLIVYRIDPSAQIIRIIRVWHGARDRGEVTP